MAWYADKLIAPAGGDYTKLGDFEAAYDGIDISGTDGVRARVKGVIVDAANVYWAGWQAGMDVDTRIVVEAESGSECDGTDATGDDALLAQMNLLNESTQIFNIDFKNLDMGPAGSGMGYFPDGTSSEVRIIKCLFRDIYQAVRALACTTLNLYIGGCLFKDISGVGNYDQAFQIGDADATVVVINTTVAKVAWKGINQTAGSMTIKNVAVATGATDISGTVTESNTLSEDDGQLTLTDADDFTAPSTDDYTVYSGGGSALDGAGAVIADAWFTSLCPTDFAGTAWANPPSVGCFELAGAPPAGDTRGGGSRAPVFINSMIVGYLWPVTGFIHKLFNNPVWSKREWLKRLLRLFY